MTKETPNLSQELSRRLLLKGACGAVGAAVIVGITARDAQAAKLTQVAANYQESPRGGAQCSKCKNFVAPSSCKQVEGTISPSGWCQLFMVA